MRNWLAIVLAGLVISLSSCSGVYTVRSQVVPISRWNRDKLFKKYQIVSILDSLGKHYEIKQVRWSKDSLYGFLEPAKDLMCVHQVKYYIHEESRATILKHRNHLHLRTLKVVDGSNRNFSIAFGDLADSTKHQVGPNPVVVTTCAILGLIFVGPAVLTGF